MKNLLKKALNAKGFTQKELAEQIHVTPQAVSKWMSGESRPSQDNVVLIIKSLVEI